MNENELSKRMYEEHMLLITSNLDEKVASQIIFNILNWSNESPNSTINIYLSSYSYDFVNTIAIYDVLKTINNPISILCVGSVGGYSTLFLTLAAKNERYIFKNTTISLNQPYAFLGVGSNQQTEVEIAAEEAKKERETYENILSESLKKPLKVIHNDVENDLELNVLDAIEYGLVDKILE